MALSRADFVGITNTRGLHIRHADATHDKSVIRGVAVALCVDLKMSNRSFDKDRFLDHVDAIDDGSKSLST